MPYTLGVMPRISLIAAVSENGVIGRDGDLPWRLPDDMRRFKRITTGHPVIMGRRTLESMDGRPLPERRNIVLTRRDPERLGVAGDGIEVARDLDDALRRAGDADEVFVIGGEAVYRAALPRADRIYLTRVHTSVEGDVHFPEIDFDAWVVVGAERHEADERHAHAFTFTTYERRRGG